MSDKKAKADGHILGTGVDGSLATTGRNGRAEAKLTPAPQRLLDLHDTAQYLAISEWTVRDLEHAGILPRVRIPLPNQGELRKLLFDRLDLDRAIEVWKARDLR